MANDIGVRVGVDGESEFKRALSDINQSLKTLGTEAKLVSSQYDKNDKSIQALTARNEVLNKQIEEQTKKVKTCADGLENAKRQYGENSKQVQSWQQKLNLAQAELNGMERELKQNKEAMENTSKAEEEATKSTKDLTKATKQAGDESKETGDKMEALGAVVKGVGTAMAAASAMAVAAVVAIGKALADMTKEGAEYADSILTQSQVTGISTDRLQEYAYAAELVDVSVETLSGSLKKNIASMKKAASGNKEMDQAYARLGIRVTKMNGELRDGEEVYWELIDALGKIDNETERDALAMTLLGKSATELNPLIEAGAERMAELGAEAREMGYVLSGEALSSYGAYDDAMQRFTNASKAAKNALGTILLPVLTDLSKRGTKLLGGFTKAVQEADGTVLR